MVTDQALIKVVIALRDSVGPNFITPWEPKTGTPKKAQETAEKIVDGPIKGKNSIRR